MGLQYHVVATPAFSGLSAMTALGRGELTPASIDHTESNSNVTFSRRTGNMTSTFVVTNTSTINAKSLLWYVVKSILPASITWINYDGLMPNGDPYIDLTGYIGVDEELGPGESTAGFQMVFYNPNQSPWTFESLLFENMTG